MRTFAYFCAAAALSLAGFAGLPGMANAAGEPALGVIETAQNSHVDGITAVPGSDFFAGEEFVTYDAGQVELRVRQCRIYLGATTDARFLPDSHPDDLQVMQGTARYRCPAGALLWIETPAGIIHGADGQPASGMIVVTDDHTMTISADGQGLVLDNAGELHFIAPGQSYRVTIAAESADAAIIQASPEQKKRRRRKLAFWLLGGGGAAFAATAGWDHWSESPWKPNP
jgi:hypothetical protein